MIKNCSSAGFLYNVLASAALDENELIVNSGTRVLLSSFSFTAKLGGNGNYYDIDDTDAPYYSKLPHVKFCNGDDSLVFGSVASITPALYNFGNPDSEVGGSTNIVGRGILFDGLKVFVKDDANVDASTAISYGLNFIYQV